MGNTTSSTTADQKVLLEHLRADCDVAFRNWAAQVRVLQSVNSGDPQDNGAIEQARRWADEAAAVYRERRNLLVEFLLRSQEAARGAHASSTNGNSAGTNGNSAASHGSNVGSTGSSAGSKGSGGLQPVPAAPKDRTRQVQKLARQIWEESGRPPGSAEDDWYQAEEILDTRR